MKLSKKLCLFLSILLFSVNVCASDWPMFKHDLDRTGYTDAYSNYSLKDLELLWFFPTGDMVRSSPAMVDINNDSILEVVVGSNDGYLYVLNYKGELLWNFSTGSAIKSSPSVADINNDNVTEIVFGADNGELYVLNSTGTLLWNFSTNGSIVSSPALVNMDETSELEIVFGSMDGKIYLLNHKGKLKWSYQTADSIESSPAVDDANNDGENEIVIGSNDKIVYIIRYRSFKVWQYATNGNVILTPAISDYDADGVKEVIVGSTEGMVYPIYQHAYTGLGGSIRRCHIATNGTLVCKRGTIGYTRYSYDWETDINFTTGGEIISSPAVADFGGDGNLEIAFGSTDRSFYIINKTGSKVMRYTTNKQIVSSPAVADLNNDSLLEIIFGSNDKRVYIINYPVGGKWLYQTNGSVRSSPAVADLTSDGTLEIAIGSDDGNLYLFGSKISMEIGEAITYYLLAEAAYEKGNVSEVMKYVNKSRLIYEEINNDAGIKKCNSLLKRLEADNYYNSAMESYNESQYRNASGYIEKASMIYLSIDYDPGISNVRALLDKMEVDTFRLEAQYFYDIGDFANATAYANKSRQLAVDINYSLGAMKANDIINKTEKHLNADNIYVNAVNQFYNLDYSENVTEMLKKARAIYVDINYTAGIKIVDKLLNRIDGKKYYNLAMQYYNESDYEKATDYASNAVSLYEQANHTTGISAARFLMNRSTSYVQANNFYDDAENYYTATDFTSAIKYVQRAKDIYLELNDTEGIMKSDLLLNRSMELSKEKGKEQSYGIILAVGIPILLIVFLRIRKIIVTRRRKKTKEPVEKEKAVEPTVEEKPHEVKERAEPTIVEKTKVLIKKLTKKPTKLEGVRSSIPAEKKPLGVEEISEEAPVEEKPTEPPKEQTEDVRPTEEAPPEEKLTIGQKIKAIFKKLTRKSTALERKEPYLAERLKKTVHTHRKKIFKKLK